METKNPQLRKALDQILDRYSDEVGEQKVPPPAAYTNTAKPSTAMRADTAKSSTWASPRMLSSQTPADTLYNWALPLKSPALASCCHGFVSDLESHRALMPSVRTPSCITTPIAPASVISGRVPLVKMLCEPSTV